MARSCARVGAKGKSAMKSSTTSRSTVSAGASDDIGDTIDYAVVVERLRSELASQHFNLLEKLAEYVAGLLMEQFGARWVRVSIAKLGMMRGVKRVGVIIERGVRE